MIPCNIVIAASNGSRLSTQAARCRLIDGWDGAAPLNVITAVTEDLEVDTLRSIDAVILLVERAEDAARLLNSDEALALLDQLPARMGVVGIGYSMSKAPVCNCCSI